MIDPDYIPARPVPYASPLPSANKPRLPGKPVQNMPPSPQRQGRRGYDTPFVPVIPREEMDGPLIVMSIVFFAVAAVLGLTTWGLGLLLTPILAAVFGASGVRWSSICGRVTVGQALVFNLQMCGAVFVVPSIWVWAQRQSELTLWFAVLFVVTATFGAAGSALATLGTSRPRKPLLDI